jgi:hypothetical protein
VGAGAGFSLQGPRHPRGRVCIGAPHCARVRISRRLLCGTDAVAIGDAASRLAARKSCVDPWSPGAHLWRGGRRRDGLRPDRGGGPFLSTRHYRGDAPLWRRVRHHRSEHPHTHTHTPTPCACPPCAQSVSFFARARARLGFGIRIDRCAWRCGKPRRIMWPCDGRA